MNNINSGFLLIDKPIGISSFYCVKKIRKILGTKIKVGHTGTLDNFASGLLIICIGRDATRLSGELTNLDKKYFASAKLGELTDTLDLTGSLVDSNEINIYEQDLKKSIEYFGQSYIQTPPVFSALKHQGRSLYKLARTEILDLENLEQIAKSKQREIKIYDAKLVNFNFPYFSCDFHVSKGTYIRSLINDIAKHAGTFATTHELQRTAIGKVDLTFAQSLDFFTTKEIILEYLIPVDEFKNLIL